MYVRAHGFSHLSGPFKDFFLSPLRLLQRELWPVVLQILPELNLLLCVGVGGGSGGVVFGVGVQQVGIGPAATGKC